MRQRFLGPRNPFGYLAFVTVTVNGQVGVHYQRGGKIFSSLSALLPKVGQRGADRADIGCFGMMLSGLYQRQRISHASLAFDNGNEYLLCCQQNVNQPDLHDDTDGALYIAAQYADSPAKEILLYKIQLCFPGRTQEEGIFCQPLAKLRLSCDLLGPALGKYAQTAAMGASHLLLVREKSGVSLVLGFNDAEGAVYCIIHVEYELTIYLQERKRAITAVI